MKINDTLKSKHLMFKNRVVLPPMASGKASDEGHVLDEQVSYYDNKTKSGMVSCTIVEHSYVENKGKAHAKQTSISDDSDIEGMAKLAKVIQKNGSLAILQLAHAGSVTKESVIHEQVVAPSAIVNPSRPNLEMPRALTIDEIQDVKQAFINAAVRAKKAGFDGVEVHSAHAYLLNEFLSPITNHRTDQYGGCIENRVRLHLEIIQVIKEACGKDYPVFIRVGATDALEKGTNNFENGLSVEDVVKACLLFEEAGVEVIDISGGLCLYGRKDPYPGFFDFISKPIHDAVSIPVLMTGGVLNGTDIQEILDRNVCDLVGVGRAAFSDSSWLERELKEYISK